MSLEDDELIEGVGSLDDPSIFSGFDCSPTLDSKVTTPPEATLVAHTQHPQRSLSDTNIPSIKDVHPSAFHHILDSKIYPQAYTGDRLDTTVTRGPQHRNTWKILRTCLTAVAQFKRGLGSGTGNLGHSRNL